MKNIYHYKSYIKVFLANGTISALVPISSSNFSTPPNTPTVVLCATIVRRKDLPRGGVKMHQNTFGPPWGRSFLCTIAAQRTTVGVFGGVEKLLEDNGTRAELVRPPPLGQENCQS